MAGVGVHHLNCGTMCPFGRRFINGHGGAFEKGRIICHVLLIEGADGLTLSTPVSEATMCARRSRWTAPSRPSPFRTLDEYRTMIENRHCDTRIAVLTSAVRDAANGSEFASSVRDRYGFEPHVLSGDDEAQLTFLGATSERDPEDPTSTLVIDVGGGSTELVIGSGRTARFHVSTQTGVVRQTERHLHHDPPRQGELEELSDEVRGIVLDAVPADRREAVERGIAVAGTATSLAAIAQQLEPYDPRKVHGHVLEVPEIQAIRDRLAAIPLEQRRQVRGLHPDRAPTIVAGVMILLEIIDLFGLGKVEVSEHDILRGAALGLAARGA